MEPETWPKPDLCNCLALRQAARHVTQFYDRFLAPMGLRTSQYSILAKLRRLGPLPINALARELVMDRTTLGRNILPLQREGLIAIVKGSADRRSKELRLTEAELSPLTLRAPMDGVVSVINHRSGEAIASGEPIVTLSALSADRIVAYLRQPIIVEPAVGMSVEVRARSLKRAIGRGRILQVGTQMEAIAESMMRLSEQSQTIGQIIATVEDLAAQSNLLAVNAAIEAAKAGEHGKGFGVVAQEVKSLAEQSRQATDRVRTILSDIQKATTAAVMATEQGGKAVEAGGRQTETAGESIAALASSVTEAAQAATQIAASSQQQLIGMDQVAGAMENIKQASTQNVASAKQLETAARNLDDLGRRLKQLVESYAV